VLDTKARQPAKEAVARSHRDNRTAGLELNKKIQELDDIKDRIDSSKNPSRIHSSKARASLKQDLATKSQSNTDRKMLFQNMSPQIGPKGKKGTVIPNDPESNERAEDDIKRIKQENRSESSSDIKEFDENLTQPRELPKREVAKEKATKAVEGQISALSKKVLKQNLKKLIDEAETLYSQANKKLLQAAKELNTATRLNEVAREQNKLIEGLKEAMSKL